MNEYDFDEEFEVYDEDEEYDDLLDREDDGFDGFLEVGDAGFDELAELDLGLEIAFDEAFRQFIEESAQLSEDLLEELRQWREEADAGDVPAE